MRTTFVVTHDKGFYFRLFGYGAGLEYDLPVLFSERNGHRRVYRWKRWAFQWLTPKGLG